MLSLVDATGRRTAACALRNCLYLFPLGALATWLGVTSPYFAYESGGWAAGVGWAEPGRAGLERRDVRLQSACGRRERSSCPACAPATH